MIKNILNYLFKPKKFLDGPDKDPFDMLCNGKIVLNGKK